MLNAAHIGKIAGELSLRAQQVEATAKLIEEGGTVPFIARYRKEATGTLDEVQITSIRDRLEQLAELDERREAIVRSLEERKLLTPELKGAIEGAQTLATLEDLYAPFRPKKRTRAMAAREAGLQGLADLLLAQDPGVILETEAAVFISKEKGIETVEAALQGARDIVAEQVSDHAEARAALRELFWEEGIVSSKRMDTTGAMVGLAGEALAAAIAKLPPEVLKYKDYFDWSEPVKSIPSHRLLAIRRGAAENVLYFRIAPPDADAVALLEGQFIRNNSPAAGQVRLAVADSWKRLLSTSMETEIRLDSKKRADGEAIEVFATNLRELLMASPLGQKKTLAIDPGFRTGCKTVVLDAQGKLLHNDVIYPDQGAHRTAEAEHKVRELAAQYGIEAIAIGNGTASRETETFIRRLGLRDAEGKPLLVLMVNESGASIYSASEVAREEFPDQDITVRGAVSIGRRLQDPLAELVKLDPKSIGVGQYQHDVDQDRLKKSLDDVVISSVNAVGVELNSASKQLLTYVSGLNAAIAENIVNHRNSHGAFRTRKELLDVPRLGNKTFEQAAGFLRIRAAENPLDASAVHPESYGIVDRMAKDLGVTIRDLVRDGTLRKRIELKKYVTDTVGLPTLTDILAELSKPGRDPRQQFEAFAFAEGVSKIEDLKPGMKVPGLVTNVTAFGAFVDIGVHQDGLVHISQLADRFIKDPNEVVKVQQRVEVTVVEVDLARKRIALSMRKDARAGRAAGVGAGGNRPAPGPARPAQRTSGSNGPAEGWFSAALKGAQGKKGGI
jgi:uncharacterized protein